MDNKKPRETEEVPPVGIDTNHPLPTGEPSPIGGIKPPSNINQPAADIKL